MRPISLRPLRLVTVLAAAALAACATVGGTDLVRRDLDWFSIEVPEDWAFSAYREGATRPGHAFTGSGAELRGPDGRFVEIHRDLGRAPVDTDVAWSARLAPTGRLEIVGPDAFCEGPVIPPVAGEVPAAPALPGLGGRSGRPAGAAAPALCLAGDGRLDVSFRLEAGGSLFLFHVGHVARERAEDVRAFRELLGTFQAR